MPRNSSRLISKLCVEALEERDVPSYGTLGYLDFAGPIVETGGAHKFQIAGWGEDPDLPSASINVHIYIDGVFAAQVYANNWRSDLGAYHAFFWDIPDSYLTGGTSHSVVAYGIDLTGDPNDQLNNTKYFENEPTQGNIDYIGNDGVVHGWGLDPNYPSEEIKVQLYVNDVWKADAWTTDYRSDINGGVGNHGFSVAIPTDFTNPTPTVQLPSNSIKVYAINDAKPDGSTNTLVGTKSYTWGDALLTNGTVSLHTAGSLAGAIDSIKWSGQEFIDSYDHGREVQSALFGSQASDPDPSLQDYNPTEAGRLADGTSSNPSSSKLTQFSAPSQSEIDSTVTAANFTTTGDPGDDLSGVELSKSVQIDYSGRDHLIRIETQFDIPEADDLRQVKLQPPIIFSNSSLLTSLGYYDPSDSGMHSLTGGERVDNKPVFLMGSSGGYVMSIYTKQTSGPIQLTSYSYDPNNPGSVDNAGGTGYADTGSGYGVLGFDFVHTAGSQDDPIYGTFTFETYISVGNSDDVTGDLSWLHTQGTF